MVICRGEGNRENGDGIGIRPFKYTFYIILILGAGKCITYSIFRLLLYKRTMVYLWRTEGNAGDTKYSINEVNRLQEEQKDTSNLATLCLCEHLPQQELTMFVEMAFFSFLSCWRSLSCHIAYRIIDKLKLSATFFLLKYWLVGIQCCTVSKALV